VTIGAFGDDPFNRCQNRQPLLGDLSIVGLDDELQTRMQSADQVLEPSPSLPSRCAGRTLDSGGTAPNEHFRCESHMPSLTATLTSAPNDAVHLLIAEQDPFDARLIVAPAAWI
jgi:hypothetical protein